MARKVRFGIGGVSVALAWISGLLCLAAGSIALGTLLMIAGGLGALGLVIAWRHDPETASEGILEAIMEFLGKAH